MAIYGVKGLWYAKAKKEGGLVTGYEGAKKLGKAVDYSFEGNTPEDNPLYADNGIAENDVSAASGGTLTVTVTDCPLASYEDLYGMKQEDVTLTSEDNPAISESATGKKIKFTGNEVSQPIGIGLIEFHQVDNKRDKFFAIVFREGTASMPDLGATTMSEDIEWQTKEMEFSIAGRDSKGTPWMEVVQFETELAAQTYIEKTFKAASEAA